MNLIHLGDALDHWKGALFERLQRVQLLTSLAVDPMTTDAPLWTKADSHLYATLLHVAPAQILQHQALLTTDRRGYFGEITHATDLFLDPDIGIATAGIRNGSPHHLKADEFHALLGAHSSRIVAVYQHIRGISTEERINQIRHVLALDGGPCCCSYESPTVAMLFFCRTPKRLKAIHANFNALLGQRAKGRTSIW